MKLHLGCGKRRLPDYYHIDIRPEVEPDYAGPVDRLPFEGDSVDLIYACHVLEHVSRPQIMAALAEWKRVLRPGGMLRVSTPDFAAITILYEYHGVTLWRILGLLYGKQDYLENTHYITFDKEYLAWLLAEAGFHSIDRWQPTIELPKDYDDYSKATINGISVSLNLEAVAK